MSTPITPERLAAAGTEHALQSAFFCALAMAPTYLPSLTPDDWELTRFCFAIPSGGSRDVVTAGRLKADGVKPGVPDTCLPVARGPFGCLWMEFKKPQRQTEKWGGMSEHQLRFKAMMEGQKHCVVPVYGWQHAIEVVRWYLSLK
jgi:hypothetical protein